MISQAAEPPRSSSYPPQKVYHKKKEPRKRDSRVGANGISATWLIM